MKCMHMYPMLLHCKCLSVGINKLQFRYFVLVSALCSLKRSWSVSCRIWGISFCEFMQFSGQVSASSSTHYMENLVWKVNLRRIGFHAQRSDSGNGLICRFFRRFDCDLQELMESNDLIWFGKICYRFCNNHADLAQRLYVLRYINATVASGKGSANLC